MDAELLTSCAMATAAVCQQVIGEILFSPPLVDPSCFVDSFKTVPVPTEYNDAAMAAFILLRFVQDFGTVVHRRLHGHGGFSCGFDARSCIPPVQVDPTNLSAWHPASAYAHWARAFLAALSERHDLTVERARLRVAANPEGSLRLGALARGAATSVSAMRRKFVSCTGQTPLQYRTRLRVIEVIRLIRQGCKGQAAAAAAGWKSPKDMYRALRVVAQTTPAHLRAMPEEELRRLLGRLAPAADG